MFIMFNMHVCACVCMCMSTWGTPHTLTPTLPQSTHPHPLGGPQESVKIQ